MIMKQPSMTAPASGVSFHPSASSSSVHYAPSGESWQLPQHARRSLDMDMLASSMMLTTISENDGCGSHNQLNKRWGSATTRKSYKTDLASLASDEENASSLQQQHQHSFSDSTSLSHSSSSSQNSDDDDDCWGFYIDES